MHQEQVKTGFSVPCFKPIDLDQSPESQEDPMCTSRVELHGKSIFRGADAEGGFSSPPTVSLANPINPSVDDDEDECDAEVEAFNMNSQTIMTTSLLMEDDCERGVISPYPYSPTRQELEERDRLTSHLGSDWSIRETDESQDQPMDVQVISDYSFFFENLPPTDDISHIDEISVIDASDSCTGSIIMEDDDISLDEVEPLTTSIWEADTMVPAEIIVDKSRMSPAHISIGTNEAPGEFGDITMSP